MERKYVSDVASLTARNHLLHGKNDLWTIVLNNNTFHYVRKVQSQLVMYLETFTKLVDELAKNIDGELLPIMGNIQNYVHRKKQLNQLGIELVAATIASNAAVASTAHYSMDNIENQVVSKKKGWFYKSHRFMCDLAFIIDKH